MNPATASGRFASSTIVGACLLAAACAWTDRCHAQPDEAAVAPEGLDAVALIGALPEAVESVMVLRAGGDELGREDFRQWYPPLVLGAGDDGRGHLGDVTAAAMAEVPWSLVAMGGSDFEGPRGIGVSNLNSRLICVFDEPPASLWEQLRSPGEIGFDVKLHETELGTVYESACILDLDDEEPIEERRFLTMHDDRVLIVTESLDEAIAIVRSLRSPARELPERWKGVATEPALESPLMVLHEYPSGDPWLSGNDNPGTPSDPYRSGLWFTGADERAATYSVRALPDVEERWARVRDDVWVHEPLVTGEFRHESGVLVGSLRIDLEHADGGFALLLVPLLSFGVFVAI